MKNFNLNELTFDNVDRWPLPVKVVMAIVLGLLIAFFGYWLLIEPERMAYSDAVTQEKTLRADFEYKQQQAANLEPYKMQLQQMNERFGNMLKQLPQQNEMPGLLEDISRTGVASGLTFELFAPMPEVKHDFYIELPINIKVKGNYHQIAIFLSRVVQLSRIVTLHDFDITATPEDAKQKSEGSTLKSGELLTMQIVAKIYRYRTQ